MPIGLMVAMMLAGASDGRIQLPYPANDKPWITIDDYPIAALNQAKSGMTYVDLSVDPRGRVYRCDVVRTSGTRSIDQAICEAARKRARFVPATDGDGQPIAAVFQTHAALSMGQIDRRTEGFVADATIALNRLPGGLKQASVTLIRTIGADGKVADCQVTRGLGSAKLDANLCGAIGDMPEPAVTDARGTPVRALRERKLLLTLSSAG